MTLALAIILFLLFLSVFLMIIEFFFIPGTTIFGLLGFIGAGVSIYYAYQESESFGHISVSFTVLLFIAFFFLGKKMMKKSNLNLETELTGKVNNHYDNIVNIGDKGITFTVLKPNGKAFIEDKKVEVYSLGEYIEKNVSIEVVEIEENKIFVKQLN